MRNDIDQLFQHFFDRAFETKGERKRFYKLLENEPSHPDVQRILGQFWDYMELKEQYDTDVPFERRMQQLRTRDKLLGKIEKENREKRQKIATMLYGFEEKSGNFDFTDRVKDFLRWIKDFFK